MVHNPMPVCSRNREHRFLRLFHPPAILPFLEALRRQDCSRSSLNKDTGTLPFMLMDTGILLCIQTPSILRYKRRGRHIHKMHGSLLALRCQRMGDLMPDSPSARIQVRIPKVNAVTGICHFVSFFRVLLDRDPYFIKAGLTAHAPGLRGKRTAYSGRIVDSFPLASCKDLYKSCSVWYGDR